ncbi:hypothetical protein EVAR_4805_1 [Eumeta japonica]|uniref:Uncharacterized protein n=1 Tax=Eumeta variegata TaxID=151549 RepID=A0A4C1SZY5_EUMVA|nr:hypothetical protein EVAR_4805_1 [Eumeta japonica]
MTDADVVFEFRTSPSPSPINDRRAPTELWLSRSINLRRAGSGCTPAACLHSLAAPARRRHVARRLRTARVCVFLLIIGCIGLRGTGAVASRDAFRNRFIFVCSSVD